MPRTVTTPALIDRALARADMVGDDFMPRAEALDLVNGAWCELHDLLVEAAPPDYYSADWTIVTTPGTVQYAVPGAFRSLLHVYAVEASGRYRSVEMITDMDRASYVAPTSAHTVLVRYVPAASVLTDDAGSSIDGVAGWDDYVVAWAARRMFVKDRKPVTELDAELAHLERRIQSQAPRRHRGAAKMVSDVESSWSYASSNCVDAYMLRAGYLDLFSAAEGYP